MPWNSLNVDMKRVPGGGVLPAVLLGPGNFDTAAQACEYVQQELHLMAVIHGERIGQLAHAWDSRTENMNQIWVGPVLIMVYEYASNVQRGIGIAGVAAEFYIRDRTDLFGSSDTNALSAFFIENPSVANKFASLASYYR